MTPTATSDSGTPRTDAVAYLLHGDDNERRQFRFYANDLETELQAMTARVRELERECAAANKGAKTNAIINTSLAARVNDTTAEADKLRGALEEIATLSGKSNRRIDDYGGIARAALRAVASQKEKA